MSKMPKIIKNRIKSQSSGFQVSGVGCQVIKAKTLKADG
jgi:hypothetical protein